MGRAARGVAVARRGRRGRLRVRGRGKAADGGAGQTRAILFMGGYKHGMGWHACTRTKGNKGLACAASLGSVHGSGRSSSYM